jgi:formylglycine-generating enzyme required for sulfatase activity
MSTFYVAEQLRRNFFELKESFVMRIRNRFSLLFVSACLVLSACAEQESDTSSTSDRTQQVAGTAYRACDNCPEMIVVPAGSFLMGSPASEEGRSEAERPQHKVTLAKAFAMGKHEVTRSQFRAFVDATGYLTQAEEEADRGCLTLDVRDDGNGNWGWSANQNWRNATLYGLEQGSDAHPVLCVSRQDALAYITWFNETHLRPDERAYRLPTEAEWEYAARAGSSTTYSHGTDVTAMCRYGNIGDQTALPKGHAWPEWVACDDGYVFTAPVGSFQANAFGLHDMHGNVWEWTEDCWHDNYIDAPVNGEAWEEENGGDCANRVARGGSWYFHRGDLRVAFRFINNPAMRYSLMGFRLAQDLP